MMVFFLNISDWLQRKEIHIGMMIMFAVRLAFSRPERLRQLIAELIEKKQVNPSLVYSSEDFESCYVAFFSRRNVFLIYPYFIGKSM